MHWFACDEGLKDLQSFSSCSSLHLLPLARYFPAHAELVVSDHSQLEGHREHLVQKAVVSWLCFRCLNRHRPPMSAGSKVRASILSVVGVSCLACCFLCLCKWEWISLGTLMQEKKVLFKTRTKVSVHYTKGEKELFFIHTLGPRAR